MLDLITKSKVRQKILKLLFANEDKTFYLSQIAQKTKTSTGTCQRELNKMVKKGILKTEKKGPLRYYTLNKQNPLHSEFKNIVNKTIGIEPELKKQVNKIKGLKYAFIFGSYAKGDFGANSDIDLYVVGNIDEDDLLAKLKKLEDSLHREINYHLASEKEFIKKIKNIKENSFYKNIMKNVLLLTNNMNEFRKLLKWVS